MRILVLQGPNLNLLGHREPEIYGTLSLSQIHEMMLIHASKAAIALSLDFYQSNHEGALIDRIQGASRNFDALIINPAAYTHYSIAIRDAIATLQIPIIEVHLSQLEKREDFRQTNVIRDVVTTHFQGKGAQSYIDALDYLIDTSNR